jgi:ubiquitin-protein ligase
LGGTYWTRHVSLDHCTLTCSLVLNGSQYCFEGAAGTPFSGGVYHGQLVFPETYPLAAPSVRMTTPNGRFRANAPICIAGITNFHQNDWSPAWTVGAIAVGVQSFFYDVDVAAGVLTSTSISEKRRLARASMAWNIRNVPGFVEKFADLVAAFKVRERNKEKEGEVGRRRAEDTEDTEGRVKKVARQDQGVTSSRKVKHPVKEHVRQQEQVTRREPSVSGAEAVTAYFKLLNDVHCGAGPALESRKSESPEISGYGDADVDDCMYFHELDESRLRDLFFTISEPSGSSPVVDLTKESQEEDMDVVGPREGDGAPHWRLQRVLSRGVLLGGVDWILKELKLSQQRKKEGAGCGSFFASKVLPRMPKVDSAAVRVLARIYGLRVREKHGVLTIIARGTGAPLTRAQEKARFQFFERELGALENLVDGLRWIDPQRERDFGGGSGCNEL